MTDYTVDNGLFAIEEDFIDTYRHWHPQSEPYAGGDALATALFMGWKSKNIVLLEHHWLGGSRRINIYHFELLHGDQSVAMPVISNPYVERLIVEQGLRVVHLSRSRPVLAVKTMRPRSGSAASVLKDARVQVQK